MALHTQFKILLLLVFCSAYCSAFYDYYWRDYTGEIPKDAVEGGWDKNNRRTYIGHVYVSKQGTIPVNIYPGNPTVVANIQGIHRLSTYVKILCSATKNRFRWIRVNSVDFHMQTRNVYLVRGGVEWGDKVTNVGRVSHQGEVIVAKVCAFDHGKAYLFFPSGNQEVKVLTYEVLAVDRS